MKILLATDGSEYSEEAARSLTCMNLTEDDEIMLVHVVSWVPFKYDAESYYEGLKQIKKDVAPKIIDSCLEILKPVRARISTAIIDGSPDRYIVEAAEESDTDLIVMGARGVKGVKSILIGSITKSVVLNSSKPVLVVKPGFCRPADGTKVVFACDGSEFSVSAARFLSTMPLKDSSEITILNVIWSDFADIPERFISEINDRIKDVLAETRTQEFRESEKMLEEAREYLWRRFSNITLTSKIGDPSHEIIRTAETTNADLIVVGCRGLRGIKGMMGSISRNILTHSQCSVLVGRTCVG